MRISRCGPFKTLFKFTMLHAKKYVIQTYMTMYSVAFGSQNITNSCIKISLHDNTLMITLHMVIYLRIGWLQVLFGSVLSSAHEERVEVGGKGRGWGLPFPKLLDHR